MKRAHAKDFKIALPERRSHNSQQDSSPHTPDQNSSSASSAPKVVDFEQKNGEGNARSSTASRASAASKYLNPLSLFRSKGRTTTSSSSSSSNRPRLTRRKTHPSASSFLASLASSTRDPSLYSYANDRHPAGAKLDPLLTAQYDEPEIISAFADVLAGEDLGLNDDAEAHQVFTGEEDNEAQPDEEGDTDGSLTLSKERAKVWKDSAPSKEKDDMRVQKSKDEEGGQAEVSIGPAIDMRERLWDGADSRVDASSKTVRSPMRSRSSSTARRRTVNKDLFLSAASDFAPIREIRSPAPHHHHHHDSSSKGDKGKKLRGKHSRHNDSALRGADTGSREGWVHNLVRFPLLLIIFLTIGLEFAFYVLTRQAVNLVEYAIAWRGKKGEIRKRLRKAENWEDWKEGALELDNFLGYGRWKEKDASGLYDWILVKKVCTSLKVFRERDDAQNLIGVLDLCLRNNFAGVEGFRLYSETFIGTKNLIEQYVQEVEDSLSYIEKTEKIPLETKRNFYRTVKKNLGTSALCLSGGASFGYYHVGVVRALLDANLLPKYVSGTSAGGLIAALTCTRHDAELKRLLVPELADRITACEDSILKWGPRVWRTGARFDSRAFAQKAQFFTMGSMTFMEAYKRTGKVLNISVIPADRHSPVKLLNYVTAPDCVIWSALLASAAVPGILNPICLMQKTKSGRVIPWNWGHRFKDGSLRMDIPLQELQSLYNVNYPIVSQVNPHVHLFFFAPRGMPGRPVAHRKGKGWRGGFILSAAEHVLKLHLSMNFKVIRDLDLMPRLLGQDWSSTFLQAFGGAVTIWPKTRAWDWTRLLSDPDRQELKRMIQVGKIVTFPKLHMIENRVRLERAVERGRKACRAAMRAREKGIAAASGNALPSFAGTGYGSAAGTPGSTVTSAMPTGQMTSDAERDDFFGNGVGNGKDMGKKLIKKLALEPASGTASPLTGPATEDEQEGNSRGQKSSTTSSSQMLRARKNAVGKAGDLRAKKRAEKSGLSIDIGASTDEGIDNDDDAREGEEEGLRALNRKQRRGLGGREEQEEALTAADLTPRTMRRGRGGNRTESFSYRDRGSISAGVGVIWQDPEEEGEFNGSDEEGEEDEESSTSSAVEEDDEEDDKRK